MGPPEATRAVSVGLRNGYLASEAPKATSEAPQAISIGLRNCYLARFQHPLKPSQNPQNPRSSFRRPFAALPWVLPRPHKLLLLGFETAIWHFRSTTSCFYWASKLLSCTFSAPLKTLKTLKTFKTLAAAFDGLSLLCHGSSRGPTSCFCWASKLLSGTSEALQAVSIGLRNCYLARFQHPLKASKPSKPSKPSQQLSTAFRCFAMGPPEAPRAVSVGLRNCYLALSRRHKMFLLGFETAIWHVFTAPKNPQRLQTLPAGFDGLSLLCHGTSRGPTSCFCWASKLLSGTSEAPQAVSIGLRNC